MQFSVNLRNLCLEASTGLFGKGGHLLKSGASLVNLISFPAEFIYRGKFRSLLFGRVDLFHQIFVAKLTKGLRQDGPLRHPLRG